MNKRMILLPLALVFLSSCDPATSERDHFAGFNLVSDEPLETDWPLSAEEAKELQAAEAQKLALPVFAAIEVAEGVEPIRLAFIPPGTFPMGSDKHTSNPPRLVRLTNGFYMSQYEIRWDQYAAMVPKKRLRLMDLQMMESALAGGKADHPARADFIRAEYFCEAYSAALGIRVRLATEAEWEYACRAGTVGLYGESDTIDDSMANVTSWPDPDNPGQSIFSKRNFAAVRGGSYEPNRWGLYDMLGNYKEWCLDEFRDPSTIKEYPRINPLMGRKWGGLRIIRGGSAVSTMTVFEQFHDQAGGGFNGLRLVFEVDERLRELIEVQKQGNDLSR